MSSVGSGSFDFLDDDPEYREELESLASTHSCVRQMMVRNERLEANLQSTRTAMRPSMRLLIASSFQPRYRGLQMRRSFTRLKHLAIYLQTRARSTSARRLLTRSLAAALIIAKHWRRCVVVAKVPVAKLLCDKRRLVVESSASATLNKALNMSNDARLKGMSKLLARNPMALPGTTVALYSRVHGRFLRSIGGCVDGGGGKIEFDDLPPASEWPAERFVVCDAGGDTIALRHLYDDCFVRIIGRSVDAAASISRDEHRFRISEYGGSGEIALQNMNSGLYLTLGRDSCARTAMQPNSIGRFVVKLLEFEGAPF